MITGAFGVLCVSLPVLISAQPVPVGEGAVPVGEGTTRVGEDTLPIGEGAVPMAAGSMRVGEGTVPVGEGTVKVGEGTVPAGEGTVKVGEGTVRVGEGTVKAGEGTVPAGEGTVKVGEGTVPSGEGTVKVGEGTVAAGEGTVRVGEGTIPVGEGAVMNVAAQQRRLQNRATAMSNPATARFFTGDAGTRLANVSANIATATGSPSILTGPSIAQLDAEDRDWSTAAITSAASRPKDLFTKDWWTAHPDVLSGTSRYYTDKPAFAWWQGSPWGELIRVLGIRNAIKPFKYRNDRNITFQNDVIYVNGQPVSSYEDFVASARELANTHPDAIAERPGWFPLGTFAVSSSIKQKTSNHAIQLTMDSAGNIAGAYVNWPQGKVLPIHGSVDTNSQRVAFNIGGSDNIVIETGLANLTEPNTRVWVHLPNSHSQTWLITRLAPGAE